MTNEISVSGGRFPREGLVGGQSGGSGEGFPGGAVSGAEAAANREDQRKVNFRLAWRGMAREVTWHPLGEGVG